MSPRRGPEEAPCRCGQLDSARSQHSAGYWAPSRRVDSMPVETRSVDSSRSRPTPQRPLRPQRGRTLSSSTAAHLEAGIASFGRGNLPDAERHFRAALETAPGHAKALHLLGLVAHRRSVFSSRVATSLVGSAGLPEMATASLEEYEQRAIALGRDPDALRELRARLEANRESCALFDTPIVRHVEELFLAMWERQERGEEPAFLTEVDETSSPAS